MVTYTVHEREDETGGITERADKIFFVRDGFAWLALVFPVLWLLYHRMWRILAGFVVLLVVVQAGVTAFGLGEEAGAPAAMIVNGAFAFLANDLRRWTLELQGYFLVELVSGKNLAECEARFFTNWLVQQEARGARGDVSSITFPRAEQAQRSFTSPISSPKESSEAEGVIGLFPEPAK